MEKENKTDLFWHYFISWLKIKNIYDIFIKNYGNNNIWKKTYLNDNELKYYIDCSQWVMWAFDWSKTNEGHSFWYGINNEWINLIRALKKRTVNIINTDRLSLKEYMNSKKYHINEKIL